jgi:hypothetical protein
MTSNENRIESQMKEILGHIVTHLSTYFQIDAKFNPDTFCDKNKTK